jgi:ABC-type Fe3+-hydroxamate transport system substrate-binding protein
MVETRKSRLQARKINTDLWVLVHPDMRPVYFYPATGRIEVIEASANEIMLALGAKPTG